METCCIGQPEGKHIIFIISLCLYLSTLFCGRPRASCDITIQLRSLKLDVRLNILLIRSVAKYRCFVLLNTASPCEFHL